jgi:pantoate--beta-alanine ligase
MKTTISAEQTSDIVARLQEEGKTVGFVPTMGALHQGHLELVKRSIQENEYTVVSIFVNPTQFNDKNDLERYPRDLDADLSLLESAGCDFVFNPDEKEIYPGGVETDSYDLEGLDKPMEGKFRPGHFQGVAMVVRRLFNIVHPNRAYFGQKDFQQLAIIRKLNEKYNFGIEIVPCSIVREHDGLAMSSRNLLLTSEHRKAAPLIYKVLSDAVKKAPELSVEQIKDFVFLKIDDHPLLDVEYFDVVDEKNLQPVQTWNSGTGAVGCIAVYAGKVRLIDNVNFNL